MIEKNRAFTIIELIVVISIFSILMGVGLYSFNSYNKARSLENDTYKIYTLANEAKFSAFTEKIDYYLYLSNDGKIVYLDNDTDRNNGFIKSITLTNSFQSDNNTSFKFIRNGFLETSGSIKPLDISDVQYNCIKLEDMVYIGKINGANCEKK